MEFVGNKINLKTILATLIVAFLIGRINLFNGTFPASIALITVMMRVSTVYIYLVVVLIGAMATWNFADMFCAGDIAAIIGCGVFFLFCHRLKFPAKERAAFAVTATVVGNCLYYAMAHITYILNFTVLAKEIVAVIVFHQVFSMVAGVVFNNKKVDKERYSIALQIIAVSLIGTIPQENIVVALWLIGALLCQYLGGSNKGVTFTILAAIFAYIQGGYEDFPLLIAVAAGLIAGQIISDMIDESYRKQIVAGAVFGAIFLSASEYIYACAVAVMIFAVLPKALIVNVRNELGKILWHDEKNTRDIKYQEIIEDLKTKAKTFDSLGKLYGSTVDSKQIISYQFQGMARVVDKVIRCLEGGAYQRTTGKKLVPIPTGSASYSFDRISGDSQRAFYYGDKLAMVISDGMGKGAKASAESALVVNTLAKLLDAGFDVDLAMKTVNGILLSKENSDIFATVDLALINRVTGRTKIFKMGAATTFVKHNGKVAVIKKPALPAGISSGLKLEYQEVKLRRGDLLIMVSDGVCDCDRKDPGCQWLIERLESMGTRDPDTVAELIVNKAAEKYQLRERDDLTVLVAGV